MPVRRGDRYLNAPGAMFSRANKLLYVFFCFLIAFSVLLTPTTLLAATIPAGDVAPYGNPDGQANVADVLILQRFVMGDLTPTAEELLAGDVAPLGSPDGVLNAGDVAVLMRAVIGDIILDPIDIGPDAPTLTTTSGITNDNPFTVTGIAMPGITVNLYVNNQLQASGTANTTDGSFSFNTALIDGANIIYAIAFDGVTEGLSSDAIIITYTNVTPRIQGGNITTDTVWTPGSDSAPYVITSDLTIDPGVTLILQPGTILQFSGHYYLYVNGTLLAQGAAGNEVVFTSGQAVPAAKDWGGIYAPYAPGEGSNVSVDYAVVEYATSGIRVGSGATTVSNSLIQYNVNGLYMTGLGTPPIITNNLLRNNYYGFRTTSGATPIVTGNSIYENTAANYRVDNGPNSYGSIVLDATGNWWGSSDPLVIEGTITDFTENYSVVVDFSSFLDGPGGNVVPGNYQNVITTNTTWNAGPPYVALGSIVVPPGVTLTIEAGAEVQFSGYQLHIYGTLLVQGIAGNEVVFTSGLTVPAVGDWGGIYVHEGSSVAIDYAVMEYAINSIQFESGAAIVSNSVIQYNVNGIFIRDYSDPPTVSPTISNNIIRNNINGIFIYVCGAPTVTSNVITSNTRGILVGSHRCEPKPVVTDNSIYENINYNYKADSGGGNGENVMDATGNWWGDSNPLLIAGTIYDYTDDRYSPVVDFSGFLDGPGGSAADISGELLINVNTDTTLLAGETYITAGHVPVTNGATLTVESGLMLDLIDGLTIESGASMILQTGSTLRFGSGAQLKVKGALTIQDPTGAPVTFTSSATTPAVSDWQGIVIEDVQDYLLDNIIVEFAILGIDITTWYSDSNGIIRNSIIRKNQIGIRYTEVNTGELQNSIIEDNTQYGIETTGWTAVPPLITGNIIQRNGLGTDINSDNAGIYTAYNSLSVIIDNEIKNNRRGIFARGDWGRNDPYPVVTGNSIYANQNTTSNELENYMGDDYGDTSNTILVATGNWWGSADPYTIAAGIWDYSDDLLADYYGPPYIDYSGFLNGPGGNPVEGQLLSTIDTDTVLTTGVDYIIMGHVHVIDGMTLTLGANLSLNFINNLTVDNGGVLIIEQGSVLRFGSGKKLTVNGTLTIQGQSGLPVAFTSNRATPAAGDWQGILITNTASNVTINYANIEYAERAIDFQQSGGAMSNTTLQNNRYGIYAYGGGANPTINGNSIITNNDYGAYILGTNSVGGNPNPLVDNSYIYDNQNYNYYADEFYDAVNTVLMANNVWWGATDTVVIATTIYDNGDNAISAPVVDYEPFQSADPIPPVIALTSPVDGMVTSLDSLQFSGSLDETATLTINGNPVSVEGDYSFSYGPVTLTEGINTYTLVATDTANNSTTVTIDITLDTIAPDAVNTSLVVIGDITGGLVTVAGSTGSAESGGIVNVVNSRTSEYVTVTVNEDGSFNAQIAVQSGDILSLIISDLANNVSLWEEVQIAGTPPVLAVSIIQPINSATINNNYANVIGTITGPANTGVTVNGVVATVSNGQFVATGVVLQETGQTEIIVYATTPDNQTATQSILVTKGSILPIELTVSPDSGIAAFDVTFTIIPNSNFDMGSMEIDVDGDGTYDIPSGSVNYTLGTDIFGSPIITQATVTHTYTTSGIYNSRVRVRDSQGLGGISYTLEHPVVVQNIMGVDAGLRAIYNRMLDSLASGNAAGALNALTDGMNVKFSSLFNDTTIDFSTIDSLLGEIVGGGVIGNIAQYLIMRDEGGTPMYYSVFLIRGEDGIWRIGEM